MGTDRNVKTTLTLEAKAQGFEATQKRAQQLRDAFNPAKTVQAFQKLELMLKGMGVRFAQVSKSFDALNQGAMRFEKTLDRIVATLQRMPSLAGLGVAGVGGVGPGPLSPGPVPAVPGPLGPTGAPQAAPGAPPGAGAPSGTPGGPPGARGPVVRGTRRAHAGAFYQGFLHGLGATFIRRGPGMTRQALGQAAGTFVRGALSAPFTGLSGITTALHAIPGVGPLGAGALQSAMGNAQQALALQRQELDLGPLVNFAGGGPEGGLTALRQIDNELVSKQSALDVLERAEAARRREHGILPRLGGPETRGGRRSIERPEDTPIGRLKAEIAGLRQAKDRAVSDALDVDYFRSTQELGRQLMGTGRAGSLQFAGQVLRASGGNFDDLGDIRAAMAAKTAYSIGPGTSGAFFRGARQGGMVGGGTGPENLARAIADAQRMGLENSEIGEYVEEIAGYLSEFKQSGIPVNSTSIAQLGASLAVSGLGTMRGHMVGASLARSAAHIAGTGPQSPAQFQMLQLLGGFQGGGLDELSDALVNLETTGKGGKLPENALKELIRRAIVAGGPGRGAGEMSLFSVFRELGAPIGRLEARSMRKFQAEERLEPDEQRALDDAKSKIARGAAGAISGPEGLLGQATTVMDRLGRQLEEQAQIENDRTKAGKKFVDALLALEGTTANVTTALSGYADKIGVIARKLEDVSAFITGGTNMSVPDVAPVPGAR